MQRMLRDKKMISFFILPSLIPFVVLVFVPIVMSAIFSFFGGMIGFNFTFVGFANYAKLFSDGMFWNALRHTMYYFSIVVPLEVIPGLMFALLIFFFAGRLSTITRVLLYIPVVLPSMGVGELFRKILETTPQNGLLNSLLILVGLEQWVNGWLGMTNAVMTIISLIDAWRGIGFYVVIFYSALVSIPASVIESARIDGAGRFAQTRYILMPLIRPVMLICLILSVNGALKVFEMPFILTKGGPGSASMVVPLYMYNTAFAFSEYGYGSVIAMVLLLMCLIITLALNRFDKKESF